jgi:hypothetical protein
MSTITLGCHRGPDADPMTVITNMVQERGRISQVIYQQIAVTHPFLKVLEPSKKLFPSGMGDVLNEVVLDVSRPGEDTVLGWQRVQAARPGYNPCCVEFKEIPYGSRHVSACLYRDGWKSPAFCKVDLAFKYEREKQVAQQQMIMAQWTKDIWSHWSIVAFQRSVTCVSLTSAYGLPEQIGRYPAYAPPTSIVTFHHLEALYTRIKSAAGEFGRVVEGHELIFIGAQEFTAFEENYQRERVKFGFQSPEVMLPEIGSVRKVGKYMFVLQDTPRRFRQPQPGESFEDCLIPSVIQRETVRGTETVRNPDYYNPEIAKYSEFIYFNASAAEWLVPPEAMTGASQMYPPSDYSGEFLLINPATDKDPFQETVYFAARYMSGMIGRWPARARCGIALAVHDRFQDVCIDGQVGLPPDPEKWFVLDCSEPIGTARLQLLLKKGTLPEICPDNHSLFAVTKQGHKFLINSIISQEAYLGDEIHTEGGTIVLIDFPEDLEDVATCREDCDGWDYVACLPSSTLSDNPVIAICGSCTPTTPDPEPCTHTAHFNSDTVIDLVDALGAGLLGARPGGGYTAATFETALEGWLAGNGGGSVTVTEGTAPEYRWTVLITGNNHADLEGAQVIYEDGFYENGALLVRTGDCD